MDPVPAERIATTQRMPLNFLENILSELLVVTQRGAHGGYRLARAPERITIADIIRAVEGPLATVRGGRPDPEAWTTRAAASPPADAAG